MPASSPGRRRSRPVADAPALDGAELAKAWLVELVALAPLERAAHLPGPRFAEDAPRLCAAVAAALAGDAALHDLEPRGHLAPLAADAGHLAAATGPLEAVTALEALRSVTWEAVMHAADRPVASQVAELADRLGAVIAVLAAATLESPQPPGPTQPRDEPGERDEDDVARGFDTPESRVVDVGAERGGGWGPEDDAERAVAEASPADRTASPADALAKIEEALRDASEAADPLAAAVARLKALEEEPPADPFTAAATRLRAETTPGEEPRVRRLPQIEDATGFSGARVTPWGAAIERRLARHRGDGLPFAVLCIELVDADRLVAADLDRDVVDLIEQAERAIVAQLRPADALIREQPGRYWLIAPDTDSADGRALGNRIAAAVEELPPHRGARIQLAIGVTTCPADATDARTLEHRAEEALFAARAGGVRVAATPSD